LYAFYGFGLQVLRMLRFMGPDVEADGRVGGPPKGPADPFVRRAVWPQPWPIETSSAEPSLEAALVVAAI